MTTTPFPGAQPASDAGWLMARRDGAIVAADARFARLIGAPDPTALEGRNWTSMVPSSSLAALGDAQRAISAGFRWLGRLEWRYEDQAVELNLEALTTGPDDVVVLRAWPYAAPALPPSHDASEATTTSEAAALEARLEALQAAALEDPRAAARAVLQAARTVLPFEFALALRIDGNTVAAGGAAEVIATYPAPMVGVEAGRRWSPLDAGARELVASGTPLLVPDLAAGADGTSPLGRLPAFGMRSALRVPLYRGPDVAGLVAVYASTVGAFDAADGIRLERVVRPLGPRFGAPSDAPAPHEAPRRSMPDSERPSIPTPAASEVSVEPPGSETPPSEAPEASEVSVEPAAPEIPPLAPPDAAEPAEAPSIPAPEAFEVSVEPAGSETPPPEALEAAEPAEAPSNPAPQAPAEGHAQRLRALGDLVAGVAHELNNPLTAIVGYAQMLPSLTDDERRRALTTIEQEALRASRIVRNVLSFARQHRARIEPVDLNAIIRRVIELRRYGLEVDNIEVTLRLGNVPTLMADEYQLEQVVLNLLSNAHQAMSDGGGSLDVTTEARDGEVRLAVTDSGPGVPPELAGRIFDPFFTTRDVGDGSGMGLATVYGIVTEHGGAVWVEPAPSGGARFVVTLPLRHERSASTPPAEDGEPLAAAPPLDDGAPLEAPTLTADRPTPDPTEGEPGSRGARPRRDYGWAPPATPVGRAAAYAIDAPRGDGARVLIVDDELPIRTLTREILGTFGYRPSTAESGEDALRLLAEQPFDAVIMDVRMPKMDGIELYARLQDRWPHLVPRTVFITGDAEGDRTAQLLRNGEVRYLEKPFQMKDLLRALADVLARTS